MDRIAGWWDGFELWVAGLPFIPQFLVVLVGMVPISFAIAYLLDRALKVVRHRVSLAQHRLRAARYRSARLTQAAAPVEPLVQTREHAQSGVR
ncbi:hypothetical protein [Nocardia cyriacigeorgica]|uniref:hypothetical protein n=1 Tax=Nocardia cyriacigeorgica TaxID=135487 RepID=UPI00245694B0|nr:hypothetical protein [Nocardia cyriacigeorgica]